MKYTNVGIFLSVFRDTFTPTGTAYIEQLVENQQGQQRKERPYYTRFKCSFFFHSLLFTSFSDFKDKHNGKWSLFNKCCLVTNPHRLNMVVSL